MMCGIRLCERDHPSLRDPADNQPRKQIPHEGVVAVCLLMVEDILDIWVSKKKLPR